MIPEAEIHRSKLKEDIIEANRYAVTQIDELKLDLLDLHYYFQNQLFRRCKDGIHWDATGILFIRNYQKYFKTSFRYVYIQHIDAYQI